MQLTPQMLSSVPFQYAQSVRSGGIVCGIQVKRAVERFYKWIDEADSKGFYLDHEAGMYALAFFPKFLQHTKGPLAKLRLPLDLSPYQQFTFYNVFAWKNKETGFRRIGKIYEKVARKNGKSAQVAGFGLFCQGFLREEGAEVYVGATKEAQAKVLWEQASQYVYKSLPMRHIGFANTTREIRFKYRRDNSAVPCYFRFLGGDSKTLDGLNPSVGIIDEYHAHKTDGVLEVIESAMGAREQPLFYIITTAGFNTAGVCKNFEDVCKDILDPENEKEDDSLLIMIHDLDEGDDWEDESVWIKANPNIGYNPPLLDYLRKQFVAAKNQPSKVPGFKTKHLNLWVDAPTVWIPKEIWRKNRHKLTVEEVRQKFLELGGFAGLDMSTTIDLTAFTMVSNPDTDGTRYMVHYVFCPADTIDNRSKEDRVPYRAWRDGGHLISTPGNVVDYNEVQRVVQALVPLYNISRVEIDRAKATNITINLMDMGINVSWFTQNIVNYTEPTKEYERLLYTGKLLHEGNPLVEWCLGACVAIQDTNENTRLHKGLSHTHGKRIDPIIAGIMGLGGSLTPPEDTNESVYNDPDVEFVC